MIRLARVAPKVVLACLAAVLTAYLARAFELLRYPWDWSPDEGLFLDYARRLVLAPASLYPKQVVPYPAIYGPLIAVLLAPLVAFCEHPLTAARALNLACVGVTGFVTFDLVRRRAGALLGAAAFTLSLAAFDLSFWHLLVRADTPMLTAFLLAAWHLMPARLQRGADRLEAGRLLRGSGCVLAAFLFKPTALLHAAPLILSWFLVDRRGAFRLSAAVSLSALISVALLELVTQGGFLWSQRLLSVHPYFPSQVPVILGLFASRTWPVLVLVVLAFAYAWRRGAAPWRDGSVTLVLGGLLVVPALAKGGAYFNYLLPLLSGLVVAGGRWLGDEAGPVRPQGRAQVAGALAAGLVALALAATTVFPLPSARDEATSTFFYGFVRSAAETEKPPILAIGPDYAYFVVGQPVEMEATGLIFLTTGAPGASVIVERFTNARYGLVIEGPWRLPDTPGVRRLFAAYEPVGECRLGSFLGPLPYRLSLRRGSRLKFLPPAGIDCRPALAPS